MPAHLELAHTGRHVYLQIFDQIRRAVGAGLVSPGEQLPTIKTLACDLAVNRTTVSRAYRELQRFEIARYQPGHGWFVREDAAGAVAATGERDVVRAAIDDAVREAHSLGVTEPDVLATLSGSLGEWYGDSAGRQVDRAAT